GDTPEESDTDTVQKSHCGGSSTKDDGPREDPSSAAAEAPVRLLDRIAEEHRSSGVVEPGRRLRGKSVGVGGAPERQPAETTAEVAGGRRRSARTAGVPGGGGGDAGQE
ncbi:unnamed protein product, partial [Scytosiphon promiscuus]